MGLALADVDDAQLVGEVAGQTREQDEGALEGGRVGDGERVVAVGGGRARVLALEEVEEDLARVQRSWGLRGGGGCGWWVGVLFGRVGWVGALICLKKMVKLEFFFFFLNFFWVVKDPLVLFACTFKKISLKMSLN